EVVRSENPERRSCEHRDRLEIVEHVVRQSIERAGADMAAPLADDQRIAIGFGTHDPAGTDGAAGPGDVLDQNGLTERCLHAFGERARDNVGRAARWERCDNGDRSRRIGLRPCDARHGRQRGRARWEMQKISAGKFHSALPAFRATIPFRPHSALMLAARMTLPHFSVSSAMSLPNSAGVIGVGSTPTSASRAFSFLSARPALTSLLSLSTMSPGVLLGAPTPYHPVAS